jgi:cytochrome c-type biogenesis protein CcmH/NrfF
MTRIHHARFAATAALLVLATATARAQGAATNAAAPTGAPPTAAAAPSAAAQPAAQPTAAQRAAGEVNPEAARLIDQVMSPFCPGLVLTNCPSLSADSLRRAIRARFDAGATRQQVLAELEAAYGDAVRAAPAQSGFGLLAWVVPGALIVLGGFALAVYIRGRQAPALAGAPRPNAAAPSPLDDELAARLRDG